MSSLHLHLLMKAIVYILCVCVCVCVFLVINNLLYTVSFLVLAQPSHIKNVCISHNRLSEPSSSWSPSFTHPLYLLCDFFYPVFPSICLTKAPSSNSKQHLGSKCVCVCVCVCIHALGRPYSQSLFGISWRRKWAVASVWRHRKRRLYHSLEEMRRERMVKICFFFFFTMASYFCLSTFKCLLWIDLDRFIIILLYLSHIPDL